MATNHRHPQPPQAPQPPNSARNRLRPPPGGELPRPLGLAHPPPPAHCPTPGLYATATAQSDYAGRVVDRAAQAVRGARELGGPPTVDGRSYLIQDPASDGAILGFNYAGDPAGIPLNRSTSPPYLTGNVLGTVTGSVRIGDVLLSVIPGEAYPQIPLAVRALAKGARGYMTAGLADDQLGYLIAPYAAYPEPIRRTFFDTRGDMVSPLDNDNYAFNVSMTIGSRVQCSLLRGAGELWGQGMRFRDADAGCGLFVNDPLFSPGVDAAGG